MDYITATELRTKSKDLIRTLKKGTRVSLINRSKVIAKIEPVENEGKILTARDIEEMKKLFKELNLPKLSYKERERRYREHLEKKYGKGLSRR